jgi:tRNA(fMet)-specific endonuclease VapC
VKILLNTDLCVLLIRGKRKVVAARLEGYQFGEVGVSAITAAALELGAAKSSAPDANRAALNQFLAALEVAPFDAEAARAYGKTKAEMERLGRSLSESETMIAGHALSLNARLVTNDWSRFDRVPRLSIENWAL